MNRYAILERGVLDRTLGKVIHPADDAWSDYLQHRRAGGDVDPLEPTPVPIETRRAQALARVAEPAARAERRPFVITAGSFYLTAFEQQTLIGVVALDAAGATLPGPFELFDDGGVRVTLGALQRRNLAEKVLVRRHMVAMRKRELEALIAAASDPEDIDNNSGWDD